MNEVEILRRLAAAASRETTPPVDVRRRVMAALGRAEDDVSRPLVWVAIASGALAAPVAALAFLTFDTWESPVVELMWLLNWMSL